MLELAGVAISAAGTIGIPMLIWVLRLQGRLVALETWREIAEKYRADFERRLFDKLDAIETYLRDHDK